MTLAVSYLVNIRIESGEAEPVAVGSALTNLIRNASPLITGVDIALLRFTRCPSPDAPRVSRVPTRAAGKRPAAANGKHPGPKPRPRSPRRATGEARQ